MIALLSLLLVPVTCQRSLTRYLFVFGDSYTATGFYEGGTQPAQFPGNPFGNPEYPGTTTSGDANWLGYLVQNFSPPNTLAYNYAGFGASVNESLVGGGAYMRNFNDQVALFMNGPGQNSFLGVPWRVAESYFVVWFGVNDIRESIDDVQRVGNSPDLVYDKVLDSYYNDLSTLYMAGARRFLLLEVPPFNRSQYSVVLGASTHETISKTIPSFNRNLRARVDPFLAAHPDARVQLLDTAPTFNEILDHPVAWGAPNETCSNRDGVSCLWWDPLHPGRSIQYSLAAKLYQFLGTQGFYAGADRWSSKAQKLFAQLDAAGVRIA